jgi:hypothetical protein
MSSNPPNDTASDVDLGLFEDVLIESRASTAVSHPRRRSSRRAAAIESVADEQKPSLIWQKPETLSVAAGVQFLTLDRGLYTVTIAGYATETSESRSSPFPAVDIVALPGQAADAAMVVSPFASAPPWPYDRDVALIIKVQADSVRFSVITYRLDEVTASPLLRIEKLPL